MLLSIAAALVLAQAAPAPDLAPPAAGAVHVYLVRHGQAFSNLDPAPDLPPEKLDRLTPLGEEQARQAGRVLAGRGVDLVLSSPAGRARETAALLRKATGAAQLRVDERLRPIDLGRAPSGAMLGWDERIAEWKAGRDPVPAGGESLDQVGQRVLAAARQERRAGPGRSILLVAHSDVVGPFLGAVQGVPAPQRHPFSVRNGSISLVEIGPGGAPRVVFSNRLASDFAPPP